MSNLWTTLIAFLVALSIAHVIMLFFKNKPRFWVAVDYVWLGVASLGLIWATADARILLASYYLSYDRGRFNSETELARHYAKYSQDYFVNYNFSLWPNTPEMNKRKRQYRPAADWFTEAVTILKKDADKSDSWNDFIENHGEIGADEDTIIASDKNRILGAIRDTLRARESLRNRLKEMRLTTGEEVLKVFSPFILIIALAIRITKVTASLKGYTWEPN